MTVLTQPYPGDTGEILCARELKAAAGDRTELIRPTDIQPVDAPATDVDGDTRRLSPPQLDALAFPHTLRRPAADDTGEILYRDGVDAPATVADVDLLAGPTRPVTLPPTPAPAPTPPAVPQEYCDDAAAQPVGYAGRHRLEDKARPTPVEPVAFVDVEPAVEVIPTRRWPNLIPRLIDLLTLRGAR